MVPGGTPSRRRDASRCRDDAIAYGASKLTGKFRATSQARPLAYPLRGPIRRPSISYRTGPLGGPTSDKNAYILGKILVKVRSRAYRLAVLDVHVRSGSL